MEKEDRKETDIEDESFSEDDVELMEEPSEQEGESAAAPGAAPVAVKPTESPEYVELNDKYLRLYSQFEDYKKHALKRQEELAKFANETLLYEIMPSLDNLEITLKHANEGVSKGFMEGVENTLRELYRVLEKSGLKRIEAVGKPFDPEYHHAIAHVERDDMDDNMVVEELRKGFTYRDKVLRASLVSVSKKSEKPGHAEAEGVSDSAQVE